MDNVGFKVHQSVLNVVLRGGHIKYKILKLPKVLKEAELL
jgi:hypothetical protein